MLFNLLLSQPLAADVLKDLASFHWRWKDAPGLEAGKFGRRLLHGRYNDAETAEQLAGLERIVAGSIAYGMEEMEATGGP